MEKDRVLILDKERIDYKLRRMAFEIWEHNSNETAITLVGIEKGGRIVAENLANMIREVSPLQVELVPININKKNPLNYAIDFDTDLTKKAVILVDDVINSGKTMIYSLQALLCYDMKKLMVAVLVDRKHKSFPIASDIVGHSVSTTLQDHIEVETEGDSILSVYLE